MSPAVQTALTQLLDYAVVYELMSEGDRFYAQNLLMDALKLDQFEEVMDYDFMPPLQDILDALLDDAVERGLIDNNFSERDLLDTRLMNCLLPRPSEVVRVFHHHYAQRPELATEQFYDFAQKSHYIRVNRIQKDVRWSVESPYGKLDLSLNLSKPEKTPEEIAKARLAPSTAYPLCMLCPTNEGFAGSASRPARQNLRVIPIELNNEEWGFQFSPYVYYNEHCIVFSQAHRPMKIDESVFGKLFDFVDLFPHYFLGSNADLPIVGGSILSHEHFQGGAETFTMDHCPVVASFELMVEGQHVQVEVLNWALSSIRLISSNRQAVEKACQNLLASWKTYTNEELGIHAFSGQEPHNTLNPIARKRGQDYVMSLIFRNNRCTEERPFGLFNPREVFHHIKKENIGLIEAMGLAILPARLKTELGELASYLFSTKGAPFDATQLSEACQKHVSWTRETVLPAQHDAIAKAESEEDVFDCLLIEVAKVFQQVLEDCAVFPRTVEGQTALADFVKESLQ